MELNYYNVSEKIKHTFDIRGDNVDKFLNIFDFDWMHKDNFIEITSSMNKQELTALLKKKKWDDIIIMGTEIP